MSNKAFAEVIESSLQGFLGHSWTWNRFPSFGSLVTLKTGTRTIFGLVYQVQTGSMDPVRYPFAYQKTQEELLAEQPQIFEFLKTTFSCLTVGYQEKGAVKYILSPEPPTIHSFIEPASLDNAKEFFFQEKYLHLIFGASQITGTDELLLAIMHQQQQLHIFNEQKLKDFINAYSLLTGNDYRRLKLFLQRAEQLIK